MCSASRSRRARAGPGGPARRSTTSPRARARPASERPARAAAARVAVSVREVENPSAHERRRAVGEHVAEPRREERHRVRRRDREREPRVSEDLELLLERLPVVGERALVVLALVVRERPRRLSRARDPGCGSHVASDDDAVALRRLRAAAPRRSRSAGQVGSDRHSPRISARSGAGRVERRTKTAIGGSASIPFCSSRSQRENQRMSSGTRSMCGPGIEVAVDMCAHGPMITRRGHVIAS